MIGGNMYKNTEMDAGSSIVCKFSHAALTEDLNFGLDELANKSWSYDDKQQLLNKLAELMLDYRKALCITLHFRGILLEILKRTQSLIERRIEGKQHEHLKFSLTLSHLLPLFPHILSFALKYFSEIGPFFHEGMQIEDYTLALEIAYRFLTFSPTTFRGLWNWGLLCDGENLRSGKGKAFFLKALSVVLDCNNEEMDKLFRNDGTTETEMCDNSSLSTSQPFKEFALLSINVDKKLKRTRTKENTIERASSVDDLEIDIPGRQVEINGRGLESARSPRNTTADGEIVFTENDLCEDHTIIANMLVPRISRSGSSSRELVAVPSMVKNIEALSLAYVSGKGVLISGPVGSGKTSSVEHFASLTGRNNPRHLFKVQLGDQTDSKALIGSYCCSDVPGEFVWRAGILTRVVTEGHWLLLEDIDCAPMDVISVLIPLLESRVLSIPGRENIQAAPGFHLFATRRVGRINRFFSESSMLEHLWSKVDIEPLTKSELEEIVITKFPNLKPLASKLVDTFSLISSDPHLNAKPDTRIAGISPDKRLSTVRDFMKWCRRLDGLSNAGSTLLSSQDIFLEAMDCFCATISKLENRMSVALAVGAKLNLSKVKVEFVCNIYKPAVKVAPLCFTVGRITLNREQDDDKIEKPNFAFTRHSLTLLESIAVCVSQAEPVLLVGETGTGKTSAVQYLATLCNRSLVVINMSQQSDSTDLIGGFKPMEMKQLVAPVREEYEKLFCETFSRKQNVKFLSNVQQCFGLRKWEVLFKMITHTHHAAVERLSKDESNSAKNLLCLWKKIDQRIQHLRNQLKQSESGQMFSFVEGALVRAIKRGDWVLLDEINLAAPETLECLNGVLESQQGSVVILERGDAEPVVRHEQFRMFACMNPANDVGKKDLPAGIRNRFTEIFVSELQEVADLKTLVFSYLERLSPPAALIDGIVRFYLGIREEASQRLTDGSGNRPYYSLRTLCRALKYASRNPCGNVLRSVYEGFCISFLTQLDRASHNVVETLLQKNLLAHVNASSIIHQILQKPGIENEKFLNFEGYWICQGQLEPCQSSDYVFTSTVKDNLKCLARIVSGRDFPVLIQGETSVGKTSLINWLAKASGNRCVRINNHEHTDIQEYLGCYTSDSNGKLVFKEGILVDAMRKGYWIILDELNLAPTDVLEALNRLLDDNRELFIPEIQETVKAHPKFMLYATQNPPGQYGERKVLSRAFRNRFVELHFEELPSKELETILHKRCNLPMSYAKTLVNIMLELQVRRRGSTVFSGKRGFITLRDLFRWADRYNKSQHSDGTFFDWNQQLAEDGYFLLAGRCRNPQEALIVQEVIQKHMKRKIDVNCLFGDPSSAKLSSFSEKLLSDLIRNCPSEFGHVVFTYNMRRLAVLVARALQFNEPVLLVGETGCGKTTICQIFAAVNQKKLYAVNCHLHTETSDFLGGLRPARRDKNSNEDRLIRLFEWCDGSLVLAMREGSMFLADEISLADDSVLERLNSVLEPERTLIVAEKGSNSHEGFQQDLDLIVARDGFQLLATMNPGGDYGKKELSPALRNRFTEIWCPANDNPADMLAIIEHNISPEITLKRETDGFSGIGNAMIEFIAWFKKNNFAQRCIVTVRDFLSWVKFINTCSSKDTITSLHPAQAYFHGAFLVFLDALGIVNSQGITSARHLCSQFLLRQLEEIPEVANGTGDHEDMIVETMPTEDNEMFVFSGFAIPRGPEFSPNIHNQYALNAPTTAGNAQRVMRAMQLSRPILLEGSPGVGKTSLVSALAKASGHQLVRINLSEQTDISDLFGADLPVEGDQGCQFSWCDGPLLLALKSGSWIVLDELNLASQSVLEGLNACFDHRGEIFIPELGMSFQVQRERTKFFACQNPLNQGGGRKGLPKSFLNRFTQVYVEPLTHDDLLFITMSMYPKIHGTVLEKMITFNSQIYQHCAVEGLCSKHGGSWEFNLRDIFRWCDLMIKYQDRDWNPVAFVQLIYVGRMRTDACRDEIWELCSSIFGENSTKDVATLVHATPSSIQIGNCLFPKCKSGMQDSSFQTDPLYILHRTLKPLESLFMCLQMNWLALLVGPKSSGKTSLARLASQLTGTKLDVMAMNSSIDTTELLGGYEQADLARQWTDIRDRVKKEIFRLCRTLLVSRNLGDSLSDVKHILKQWFTFWDGSSEAANNIYSLEESIPSTMLDNISHLSKLVDNAINVFQKYNFTDYKFERFKVLLKELGEHLIQNNGNSHVSGQFEWVDGQLVKALKNGHWLLIDNVNFCSPSVLDRLNGLLEPGGMLSINERGVVDGDIPVVKPHPDFRLIFAMDSKHGEISRAMRNRGVEIFMSQEDCDADDLCSMLYTSSCRHPSAIQTLASIHSQDEKGPLLQTIHAGSLVNELWQRGCELEKALAMSLDHIHGQSFDLAKLAEDQSFQEPFKLLKCEEKPSAEMFQKDAVNALITCHALPLERIIEDANRSPAEVNAAANVFLEWCSRSDWRARLHWLKSRLLSSRKESRQLYSELHFVEQFLERLFLGGIFDELRDVHEKLETQFLDFKFDASDHPLNLRVNGPLYKYICDKILYGEKRICNQLSNHTNRVYLLWTLLTLEAKIVESCIKSVDKAQLKSPLWLSFSHTKGDLNSESLPHRGIVHIYPLLNLFQQTTRLYLENSNTCIIDEQKTYEVWVSLKQYEQFVKACRQSYSQQEEYHVLLDLHCKFFWNGACKTVFGFLEQREGLCTRIYDEYMKLKDKLNKIFACNDEVAEYHWKMITDFEHPAVFVFEEVCHLWAKLTNLYSALVDHNPDKNLQTGLMLDRARAWQVALLEGLVALIELREEKLRREVAEDILAKVKESVQKIEHEQQNLYDVSKISSNSQDVEHTEILSKVYSSEVIQGYCNIMASYANVECINVMKLMSLRKKILDRTGLSKPGEKWLEKLTFCYNFCVKFLCGIPLNMAVVKHIISNDQILRFGQTFNKLKNVVDCTEKTCSGDDNGFPKSCSSVLKLADNLVFCDMSMTTIQERDIQSNVAYLSRYNRCSAKTFEALSVVSVTKENKSTLSLVDMKEKIVECHYLNMFLWLHQNSFENLKPVQLSIDWQSLMLALIRLLHCLNCNKEMRNHAVYANLLSCASLALASEELQQNLKNSIAGIQEIYSAVDNNWEDSGFVKYCFSEIVQCLWSLADTGTGKDNSTISEGKIQHGLCWIYMGMIQSTILRPVGNVDPVKERNVKVDNLTHEIEDLRCELKIRLHNERTLTGMSVDEENASVALQVNPSHVKNLIQYKTSLECELAKIGEEVAYRPVPSQFRKITGILQDFSTYVGNYSDIISMTQDLCSQVLRNSCGEVSQKYIAERMSSAHRLKVLANSCRRLVIKLQDFVAYQDILEPYISGIIQIAQGLELVLQVNSNSLKWIKFKVNSHLKMELEPCLPQEIVSCVLPFSSSYNSMSSTVDSLLSEEISHGLEVLYQNCPTLVVDCKERSEEMKSRIWMLALNILKRSVSRAGFTTPNDIQNLKTVVNCYKTLWLRREKEKKLQEEEDESLYKFKTKTYCDDELSEEQQDQNEIHELFTRFDQEYEDIHLDEREDSSSVKKQESSTQQVNADSILESHMAEFCKIHQLLVSSTPYVSQVLGTLNNTAWKEVDERLENVKIVSERYHIAAEITNLADLCDDDMLVDPTSSHLVMSSLLLKSLSSCQDESIIKDHDDMYSTSLMLGRRRDQYDIYHDSNLKEIIQVLPMLTSFKCRLQQLLQEWPDHPTLIQLCQTIDRIISFPVTSPVMKILNGLEILLKHSQEWEANASRHVSIRVNLDQITEMIIRWRKLELSSWSSLLSVCEIKTREKANHWWFHVNDVVQQYSVLKDGESPDFTELIKVLQQFIECSPIGEFSERLNILVSFCHQKTIDVMENDNSGVVRTILWNIYCYYKQFESRVVSLIEKAKAPIEKELKDFIKIVKWKDINYWAMKETSTRSHYTLLKLMKKYQTALSEGIDTILKSNGEMASVEDAPQQDELCSTLDASNFLSPVNLKKLELHDREQECPPWMFSKMRKLTQQKLTVFRYEVLSKSVAAFTDEIISTTKSLQKLEIGDKTGKARTQFSKHIHVLKKRGLADLFKGLKKLGLSYRKGVRLRQQNSLKDQMMVDCTDVSIQLSNVDKLRSNNETRNLVAMLENSLKYYQKCVARFAVLNNVLTIPSKELTVGDVDRMKGFAEHLRQITQRQRENISAVGRLFSELNLMMRQLTDLATRQTCHLPPQCMVAEWTLKLDKLLNKSLETSGQLLLLLDACPDSKIDLTMSPVSEQLSELSKCCKQDNVYISVKNAIQKFHEEITQIKSNMYFQTLMLYPVSNGGKNDIFIATWSHFKCLESSFNQLESALVYFDEFVKIDTRPDHANENINPSDLDFGKLTLHLRQIITKTCDEFANWNKSTFEEIQDVYVEEQNSSFRAKVTSAREGILLTFQKWYKRRDSELDKAKDSSVTKEIEDDKYFVEELDNQLLSNISTLNIEERTKDIKSCIKFFKQAIDKEYTNYRSTSIQTLCGIMIGILPCLSQYVLLAEYHFQQLLLCHKSSCKLYSVLLGIFSELLQKGFCLPPDEEEMDGEGATSFEDAENCGMGEGEGRRDVSDQIEDEGQLQGAEQQKDQEKKEGDDNQIPDEEHGIEMSEDFEGETHDVEKTGESSDEDGESDDERENLEQKMGDVDGADEILDEKLWADSDAENNDDDKDNDGDERGKGAEGEDQSELVAKEENQGSSKESKNKPKMDDIEEDKINELGKNEDDMGNLDESFSDSKNEPMPDEQQPEDLKLADDLELDTEENEEAGDDAGDTMDDEASEKGADDIDGDFDNDKDEVNDDKNSGDEIDSKSDFEMDENQGGVEEISKEVEDNENEVETSPAEDEKEDDNMAENEWKTESETKGENVESVEDEGNPDGSSGLCAGKERSEAVENETSIAEGDNEGTGNSMSQQSGQDSTNSSLSMNKATDMASSDTSFHRKQLNKSRADRSLGSSEETASKKPKVLDSTEDASSSTRQQDTSAAELFEHLKDDDEMHDLQVYDTATEEQRKQQEAVSYPTETVDNEAENMDEDWELPLGDNRVADGKEEKTERSSRFQSDKNQSGQDKELNDSEVSTEDQIQDRKQWRDTTSAVFMGMNPSFAEHMEMLDPEKSRSELEELLCKWRDLEEGSPAEQIAALETWHRYELLTSAHSQQLCEQLRIVLEPSIANKLRGDYRTGKRLNMRKVISYIASQYRKDKIWLRRTKKSKRQYQILLAIDDSSSMCDNQSKQLAFESLAVITNALTRLEAGEIAICSFGEDVCLLHPFHETFTEQSGANILRQFRFEQKQTKIAQLLDTCASVMTSARSRANAGNDVSQLLLIVSDGRGIFLEGVETVHRAVRKAREAGIFLVFVILDNPRNKDSILDIKFPIFRAGQLPELKSYIEQFPFPYYIVLRDIGSLPETLSDSLKQWFELVANTS